MNHAASIRVKPAVMHKEVRRSATDLENRPIAPSSCMRLYCLRQNARNTIPIAFLMNVIVSAL